MQLSCSHNSLHLQESSTGPTATPAQTLPPHALILDAAVLLQDGNTDLKGIKAAVEKARAVTDKPSFIKVSTLIGYGSPNKANTHGVHGSPLGEQQPPSTARHSLHGGPPRAAVTCLWSTMWDSAMQTLIQSHPKHIACRVAALLHVCCTLVC